MKRKRLVALIAGVVALFAAATCGAAESDADVAALLEMWAEMYDGTPYWQLVEELPDGTKMPLPDADDISKEKALEIATRSVMGILETDAAFLGEKYMPMFGFTPNGEWMLSFFEYDTVDGETLWGRTIWVAVDAETGIVRSVRVGPEPGPIDNSQIPKG